ncbi:hypothetical protein HZA40_01800 [Candidatus Peregrinibacteria bacterium]|nr:hypothetical protein [Candidatus Peregrinibacteria bacterium]
MLKKILIATLISLISIACNSSKPTEPKKINENTVFKIFCEDKKIEYPKLVKINKKFTEENRYEDKEKRQALPTKPVNELFQLLDEKKSLEENGDTLYTIGLSYAKNHQDEEILKYWQCAAEKYFDTKSMLKLAKVYFSGSEGTKLTLKNPVAIDYNKAYFWILNSIYIDSYQGQKNNIIANGLGLMDELQNVDGYTEKGLDMDKVEQESRAFIGKLYPENELTKNSENKSTTKINLVQTGAEASCVHYELQNESGKKIETTKEIEKTLSCPPLAKISTDYKYLLYLNFEGELKTYDFENKITNPLMSFLSSSEGISCNWNAQNTKIACVAINSKDYKNHTKVFTLKLDQGKLSEKEIYDEKIPYHCGSLCYTYVEFKDDKTLILGVDDLPKKTLDIIP